MRQPASGLSQTIIGSAIAALALLVAWRLGLFHADTFASIDHPFHIARAETLRRSLLHGEILRWVSNHQGGYPVEFYPLGFAYFEVFLWGVSLGLLSIPIVHKIAVVALFLAPGLVFWRMARDDGWPATVALVAFAAHVAAPGTEWQGGYTELVYMGLVTNVGGAFCALVALVGMTRFAGRGRRGDFALAVLSAASAVWINPRSALGLVACGIGVWLAASLASAQADQSWRRSSARLISVAAVAALLVAPELISLARYGDLYQFVQYSRYDTPGDYLSATVNAVSIPVFALAAIGFLAAFAPERPMTSAAALTLIVYAAITASVSFSSRVAAFFPQLEATRLMPLQRFLTIYLAAVGCAVVARSLTRSTDHRRSDAIQIAAALALLIAFGIPFTSIAPLGHGLFIVERSTDQSLDDLRTALKAADRVTPAGTAILVVGSTLSRHQQFWAPVFADRAYFYDDWMWYWHARRAGPYNPFRESRYANDRLGEIFTREYLDRDAIGSVLVAGRAAQRAADGAQNLQVAFDGPRALYTVRDPKPFVTFGGSPARVNLSNHFITAVGTSAGGQAVVRRNWFPRWRATVNSREAAIERRPDGFMQVAVPPGPVDLRLTYVVEPLDWVGRAAALLGALVLAAFVSRRPRPVQAAS